VVVSELKPKLLLDPVKFGVGDAPVDRAHGPEPQPPHGLLTETTAAFSAPTKPCPPTRLRSRLARQLVSVTMYR
jgi:hypothetical protein